MTSKTNKPNKREFDKDHHPIPKWCSAPMALHNTEAGCFGLRYGYVEGEGEDYCKEGDVPCEYYRGRKGKKNHA